VCFGCLHPEQRSAIRSGSILGFFGQFSTERRTFGKTASVIAYQSYQAEFVSFF
jgi:hypothetical protein